MFYNIICNGIQLLSASDKLKRRDFMRMFSKQTIAWLLLAGMLQSSISVTALADSTVPEAAAVSAHAQGETPEKAEEVVPAAAVQASDADEQNIIVPSVLGVLVDNDNADADVQGSFDEKTGTLTISGSGVVTAVTANAQWAKYRSKITSVVIENGIEQIGDSVFQNYEGITKVTFPSTLTTIGNLAFSGCVNLTSVAIPAVDAIGNEAFRGCKALSSATIADGVTAIPNYCFAGCTSLQSVAVPSNTLTSIGKYAFSSCGSLEYFNYMVDGTVKENIAGLFEIPDGVVSIDDFAFEACIGIKSLIISETVSYIGGSAFITSTNLKEVSVADGKTPLFINAGAFKELTNLTTVTLNRATYLGQGAFEKTGISRISLPSTLTEIDKYCFRNSALEELTFVPSKLKIGESAFGNCEKLKTVDMMVSEDGVGIYDIGKTAFESCTALTEIVIPSTITNMGEKAFQNCTSLADVTISEGAQYIGMKAFLNDPITEITIPSSVTNMTSAFEDHTTLSKAVISCADVSSKAFKGCKVLSSVKLNDGVKSISSYAFSGCTAITTIDLPESTVTLGSYAFYDCTGLVNFNGRNRVDLHALSAIGISAFEGCTAINNVTWADSVTTVSKAVFKSCTSLSNIKLGDNVTIIDNEAFKGTALKEMTMPTSLTKIGDSAFANCTFLAKADMTVSPNIVTIGDSAFSGDIVLNNVSLPAGVVRLNNNVFKGCVALSDISVASAEAGTLTYIGNNAFDGCKVLKGFNIPGSVTNIGNYAFNGCAVMDISIEKPDADVTAVTWGNYAFADCSNLGKSYIIQCPDQLKIINNGLFKNCVSLRIPNDFIPENVTAIGNEAFSGCTNDEFTGIIIPAKVARIGDSAFYNCRNIENVDFRTSVLTTIGREAFAGCEKIANIVVPVSVTTLGAGTFKDCSALCSVTLSGTRILAIPDQTFMNCYSLHTVEMPGGYYNTSGVLQPFRTIGKSAFAGCHSLGSVEINGQNTFVIPLSTTAIGESAFEDCDSLKYIVAPLNATLGKRAFANCTSLETAIILSNKQMTDTFAGCENLKIFCYPTANLVISYAQNNSIEYEFLAGSNGTYIAVLKQPANWTAAKVGDKAVFVTNAVSDGALQYIWYIKLPGEKEFVKSNTTGDTFTINVTEASEGTAVYCMINETKNEASSEIINTINTETAYITSMTTPVISDVTKLGEIKWGKVSSADKYIVYRATTENGAKTKIKEITNPSVTTYTDSTAADGATYFYFVTAVNNVSGVNITSEPKRVTIDKVPGITTITSAVSGDGQVSLEWKPITKARQYRVQRSTGSTWQTVATITSTSYVDKGLVNGTTYSYRIVCNVNNVWKDPSEVVKVTPMGALDIPEIASITTDGTSVYISWSKITDATHYRVYRADSATGTKIELKTVETTNCKDSKVTAGRTYYYFIAAYDSSTDRLSAFSIPRSIKVEKVLDAPVITSANSDGKSVSLKWNAVTDATSYSIFRADSATGAKTQLKTVSTLSYTDTTVTEGKTYYYFVVAHDSQTGRQSAYSEAKSVKVQATKPYLVGYKAGDCKVKLEWKALDGAEMYRVYYYLNGKYTRVFTTDGSRTIATVSGLTGGTRYGFVVSAKVNGAWTAYNDPADLVYVTPTGTPKPTIVGYKVGENKVKLQWNEVPGAEMYRVYYHLGGKYTRVFTTDGSRTIATVSGLSGGTEYGFVVSAKVNGAWTAYNDAADLVYATPTGTAKPFIIGCKPGDGKVKLEWQAVPKAEMYRVYYYLNGKYTRAFTTDGSRTIATVSGLTNGTEYSFIVSAKVNGAWTDYTNPSEFVLATPNA